MRRLVGLLFGMSASVAIFGSAIAADLNPAAVAYVLPDKIEWKQTSPRFPPGDPGGRSIEARPLRRDVQMAAGQHEPAATSNPKRSLHHRAQGHVVDGDGHHFRSGEHRRGAGRHLRHAFGKQVHYDGAKDEETVLLITGEGPATSTPAEKK